jgi:hypothetical protein
MEGLHQKGHHTKVSNIPLGIILWYKYKSDNHDSYSMDETTRTNHLRLTIGRHETNIALLCARFGDCYGEINES